MGGDAGTDRGRGHVIDGAVPLVTADNLDEHAGAIRAGGVTALAPTVASLEGFDDAMAAVRRWHQVADASDSSVVICRRPGDLERAREIGALGIVLHFQGCDPIEGSLERLAEFAAAGVRVMQPTYNDVNLLGGGSLADPGLGLTAFGTDAVGRMADLHVIPDISHANERTALDVLDTADGVVIASHSNARSLYDHPRNISDMVIRRVAEHGGVVGVCGFPGFLGPDGIRVTSDDVLDHVVHIAGLVGERHVSLGLDFADEDDDDYDYFGYDPRFYPRPPWTYPPGIAGFADFPLFAERALQRGLGEDLVAGLMGENYAGVVDGPR